MTTNETLYVLTYSGTEWGFFTLSDLVDMGLCPESRNVRVARKGEA